MVLLQRIHAQYIVMDIHIQPVGCMHVGVTISVNLFLWGYLVLFVFFKF